MTGFERKYAGGGLDGATTGFEQKSARLVLVAGHGGVGKTTFAAALGVARARAGHRVLLLTADPARRLADALGVRDVHDAPSQVSLPRTWSSGGALDAAMLESKASFDELMRRIAGSRAARVLRNPVYHAFSRTLARSHAYAATERIYAAIHDDRYDQIVVDTPPAQSAFAILDAPNRLVRFLDQRVVRWFSQARGATSSAPGAVARNLLALLAGDSTVAALTEFISDMAFLSDGFLERAQFVRDYLGGDEAEFMVVGPAADADKALQLSRALGDRAHQVRCIVLNKAILPDRVDEEPLNKSGFEPSSTAMHRNERDGGSRFSSTTQEPEPHDGGPSPTMQEPEPQDGGPSPAMQEPEPQDGGLSRALIEKIRQVRADVRAQNELKRQSALSVLQRAPEGVEVRMLPHSWTALANVEALDRWVRTAVHLRPDAVLGSAEQ